MALVTITDVTAAVNKAFNAGLQGQAYEGLMPSAHDAGVHFATEFKATAPFMSTYLATLVKAAERGFSEGQQGFDPPKPGSGEFMLPDDLFVSPLLGNDVHLVYVEGYQAGKASKGTNWTPWLIGAGALAVVGIGAVVMTRKANPTMGRTSDLDARIARALGWPIADVHSMSLQSLRELVRPVDTALAEEITLSIGSGSYITRKRNPAKNKGERQRHSEGAEIIDNMARVVWADFWARREEDKGVSFSGVDVFDAAPKTPTAAKTWALDMARQLAEMNGLDPRHPYAAMEELYAKAVAANEAAGQDSEPAERFGSDLGLMITGAGVSWFDDNAKFDLKKPYGEFWI